MIIAIDGPAGSGKSTVAKLVAQRLGFNYLDTGAMYRSIAWLALERGVDLSDKDDLVGLAQRASISFGYTPGVLLPTSVIVDGHDVTDEIRTPRVDEVVSKVAADPFVREALVRQQREIARDHDTVLEGRDIGTAVFPDAEVKIFLTADPEIRAQRRALQNKERYGATDAKRVLEAMRERDRKDSTREVSPLVAAKDAHILDTSSLTIEHVVDSICSYARELREER